MTPSEKYTKSPHLLIPDIYALLDLKDDGNEYIFQGDSPSTVYKTLCDMMFFSTGIPEKYEVGDHKTRIEKIVNDLLETRRISLQKHF